MVSAKEALGSVVPSLSEQLDSPPPPPEMETAPPPLLLMLLDFWSLLVMVSKVARWQNLIPSFTWNALGWRAMGRNPRKGRDQILLRSVAEP